MKEAPARGFQTHVLLWLHILRRVTTPLGHMHSIVHVHFLSHFLLPITSEEWRVAETTEGP